MNLQADYYPDDNNVVVYVETEAGKRLTVPYMVATYEEWISPSESIVSYWKHYGVDITQVSLQIKQ